MTGAGGGGQGLGVRLLPCAALPRDASGHGGSTLSTAAPPGLHWKLSVAVVMGYRQEGAPRGGEALMALN